ncbi:MAG: N-acyl homoserine lactonase family protein [Proteobacteria bacterium]|nr:N-acyl homoserine lactonase family protein [Pseudomonadota bacterium]
MIRTHARPWIGAVLGLWLAQPAPPAVGGEAAAAAAAVPTTGAPAPSDAATAASTLAPAPRVSSPRLYVLDCGTLVYNRPEDYNLKREEVRDSNMGVTCYLVVHPKGLLLFDTGLNDRLVGRPLYENVLEGYGQIKFNTLSGQLADIGVTPASIGYLVLSHFHWDHVGNAGDFARSTWLVYDGDRAEMFSAAARATPWFGQYAALEAAKTVRLRGDYDVFGDGTVMVIATPGHTPGHCSLLVRLRNTGPVVLSGDLYHYAEERELDRMPDEEKTTGTAESRRKVEELLRRQGAQLWIGHSMAFFRSVRKSPAWYD